MAWEDIKTAPMNGTPILAECRDGETTYIASVAYWALPMLQATTPYRDNWKAGDEYWSRTEDDFCCEPIRWLKGFDMPASVTVET